MTDPPPKQNDRMHVDAAVAGPLFMLSSALLFTVLNVLIKSLNDAFSAWHIGFYRFLGGLIVLVAVFGRGRNPYRGVDIRLLVLRGCTGSVAFLFLVTAIRLLPLSTAMVIFYAFPVFAAVFSFFIYGERIGPRQLICILVVLLGVAVLFDFQLEGGLAGQLLALLASIFAGLTVTLIRTLREKNGPVIIYLYFCTMGALLTTPYFVRHPLLPATPVAWGMILGIIFTSVMAQLLMNQGFFYCKGWEGGVFMSSEVVFTAIVGIAFLGDPATLRFWLGGLMIFGAVVALNRFRAT
jgi:drug/metabolite transporter (DMT)-like permease